MLVAWNGSTEQARTNAFAMPLLREAEQVTVLTVEGGMTPGPAGDDVALHLRPQRGAGHRRHGRAGQRAPPAKRSSITRKRSGCDLLVKGAYAQSRLRQMIFGGATRHILANATLPVLMAH